MTAKANAPVGRHAKNIHAHTARIYTRHQFRIEGRIPFQKKQVIANNAQAYIADLLIAER